MANSGEAPEIYTIAVVVRGLGFVWYCPPHADMRRNYCGNSNKIDLVLLIVYISKKEFPFSLSAGEGRPVVLWASYIFRILFRLFHGIYYSQLGGDAPVGDT